MSLSPKKERHSQQQKSLFLTERSVQVSFSLVPMAVDLAVQTRTRGLTLDSPSPAFLSRPQQVFCPDLQNTRLRPLQRLPPFRLCQLVGVAVTSRLDYHNPDPHYLAPCCRPGPSCYGQIHTSLVATETR